MCGSATVHTARVQLLLRLFPKARFIYIHRNPYEVPGFQYLVLRFTYCIYVCLFQVGSALVRLHCCQPRQGLIARLVQIALAYDIGGCVWVHVCMDRYSNPLHIWQMHTIGTLISRSRLMTRSRSLYCGSMSTSMNVICRYCLVYTMIP